MAKLNVEIDGKTTTIDTNDFPEIGSEVRSELEAEYIKKQRSAVSDAKKALYREQVNPLRTRISELESSLTNAEQSQNSGNNNDGVDVRSDNNANQGTPPSTQNQNPAPSANNSSDPKIAELENKISSLSEMLSMQRKRELRNYRESKVSQYNGEIIEDMVSGEDEDSIDESIKKAHEAWKKVAGRFQSNSQQSDGQQSNGQQSNGQQTNGQQSDGQQPPVQNGQQSSQSTENGNPTTNVHNAGSEHQEGEFQSPNTVIKMDAGQRNDQPPNQPTMRDYNPPNNANPNDPHPPSSFDVNPNASPIDVTKMSHEEYARHRERLLKSTGPSYAAP